jgi:carboxyl-terminal processing protease
MVAIFVASIFFPLNGCAQRLDALTVQEKEAIKSQKKILDEIAELYAKKALERPKDFAACVREMFAMRRSGKCRDKFTHYYTPEEFRRADEDLVGSFGGVGLEIMQEEDAVVVIAPIGGTPAERAGIRPRDVILKVDGKEVGDIYNAVSLLRGKPGTKVSLTIFRKGSKDELVFTLTREIISNQTVKWRLSSVDKKIGIIVIRRFDRPVPAQFAEAVVGLIKKGAEGAVIDLRNNPGGLVDSVLALLGLFANDTDTLMTYRYRHSAEVIKLATMPLLTKLAYITASVDIAVALKINSLKNFPVVILINNGSASASEIFSGTMKDWGYPIVGEKSYGKGVGQEMNPLSDGSCLVITTFEFLVGNGRVAIRDKGVKPTIEVKPTERKNSESKKQDDKDDAQLMKAKEVLQLCGKKDASRAYKCTR